MKEIFIMAAGAASRWEGDKPKQLFEINGEPVLHRTVRQLHERGYDPFVTARHAGQWGFRQIVTTPNEYEIDRLCGVNRIGLYLYGDAYYTDEALDLILADKNDWHFFGDAGREIFAINANRFVLDNAWNVRSAFAAGLMQRCIGWEVYAFCNGVEGYEPYYCGENIGHFTQIEGCEDFDTLEEYNNFNNKMNELEENKRID